MKSYTRHVVVMLAFTVVYFAVVGEALSAPSPDAFVPAHEVSDLQVRLSVQKDHLAVGEPILIKVDVLNRSSELTGVWQQTPWDAVEVIVLREGAQILPAGRRADIHWPFAPDGLVQPGREYTYFSGDRSVGRGPFYPLSLWGFSQALPPGRYTIYVKPTNVIARRSGGHTIAPPRSEISNKIDVVIN